MNGNKPWYKRKKFWKWAGISYLAIMLVGIVGGFLLDITGYTDKVEAEEAQLQAKSDAEAAQKAQDRRVAEAEREREKEAKKAAETERLAKRTNAEITKESAEKIYGKEAIVSVEYVEADGEAIVKVRNESFWSAGSLRETLYMDAADLLKELHKIDGLQTVNLQAYSPLTDKYGNTEDGLIMTTQFYSETLAKINYDNINPKNIPDIADVHWQHADMNK